MTSTSNTNIDFEQIQTIISNIIKNTIDDLKLTLSTNSKKNLAVHLSIAIIRLQSDSYIPLSNGQIASYKQEDSYTCAKELCNRLSKQFNIEFPEDEISLVSMYLTKNQKLDLEINSGYDLLDDSIYKIIDETMTCIYKEYNKDFRKDDKLFVAIGLHLEPALERLSNVQTIKNPLKDEIIRRHQEEFNYSKVLNKIIKQETNLSFDDDELAYITLHFVIANNKMNKLYKTKE